jgi:geranylgeranyl pyrophosphate synthase/predicted secreted hydrolase
MRKIKEFLPTEVRTNLGDNLAFHHDEPMEWWFIQGYFEGKDIGRKDFMCAAFCQRFESKNKKSKYGFVLIKTIFDHQEKTHSSQVQVNKQFLKSYLDEIKRYGFPNHVEMIKQDVEVGADKFKLHWPGFLLKQGRDGLVLKVDFPDQKTQGQFALIPELSEVWIKPGSGSKQKTTMAYLNCPRLKLSGKVNGSMVKGQVWFDQQWGGYSWFRDSAESGQVNGWDWMGVNLSDGRDMIIFLSRDMRTRRVISKQAVLYKKGKLLGVTKKNKTKVLSSWQSPKTRITYPVQWKFSLPEFSAEVEFTPFVNDQEIPFFGAIRAVWDGAGIVKGTLAGKKIKGRGWLELQGDGYLFDFNVYLDGFVKDIDKCLQNFIPQKLTDKDLKGYLGEAVWKRSVDTHNDMLSKPVWDLLSRGGKHWRPIFGLLLLEILGVDSKPYEALISSILELNHSGALIIDDIEDKALLRRKAPAIHHRYGVDVAINAGNTLYFLPYLLIKDYPGLSKAQELKMYEIVVRVLVKSHFGQGQDIYWSRNLQASTLKKWMGNGIEDELFEMYSYKTASIVEGVARFSAVIAESDEKTEKALVDLARVFGVAFQIVDDINNFSSSPQWTKVCGEDIVSGKPTYVIIKALKSLPKAKQKRLKEILVNEKYRNQSKNLKEAVSLIRESGALEECRKTAKKMVDQEWAKFSRQVGPSEPKTMLRLMCDSLLRTK